VKLHRQKKRVKEKTMADTFMNTQATQLTIHEEIEKFAPQFKAALPAHVSVEKFTRVLLTAIASDPDLAQVDRRSLFESALRCAADGLLPDLALALQPRLCKFLFHMGR
jgi:recombination protein RecT